MPRVFTHTFTVSPGVIDELRHVNNPKYLAWMQDVAIAHSAARGGAQPPFSSPRIAEEALTLPSPL